MRALDRRQRLLIGGMVAAMAASAATVALIACHEMGLESDDDRFEEESESEVGDPGASTSNRSAGSAPKRPLSIEDASALPPPKKHHLSNANDIDLYLGHHHEFAPTPEPDDTPDPASQLPPASKVVIQLRFQLCRFKGVYRVVRLPLSFTFAHLYRLILFLFGWSGHHLHQAEIVTHAELYSANYRKGEIKKHRSFRVPEEPDKYEDIEAWRDWLFKYSTFQDDPAMRITPKGSRKTRAPTDANDEWDVFFDTMQVPHKKDAEVTLGDVWAWKSRKNLAKGDCENPDIAIKFEYDLGSSWDVHITVEPEKNGEYMWKENPPRSAPTIKQAKGAPPLEDAVSYHGDIEGKNKTVSYLLFGTSTFERYLRGEVRSVTRKTELAVYDVEKERIRQQQLEQEREQRKLSRQQEGLQMEDHNDDEDDEGGSDEDVEY